MNDANVGDTPHTGLVRRFTGYAIGCAALNLAICWLNDWKLSALAIAGNVAAFAITALLLERYSRRWGFDRLRRRVEAIIPVAVLADVARRWLLSPVVPLALMGIALRSSRPLEVEGLSETARAIHYAVQLLGMFWLLWWFGRQALSMSPRPIDAAKGLIERVLTLWVALLSVRVVGTELSETIDATLQHPAEALAWLVAYWIVRCASVFTSWIGPGDQHGYPAVASGRMRLDSDRLPRTEDDIRRTAVHEAGHALMFSQCGGLPDRLSVSVRTDWSASDRCSGSVTYQAGPPELRTEAQLKWQMLTYLAGSEAERLMLGDRCEGALEDNEKWTSVATVFLATGFGEVFYSSPAEKADQLQHNRMVLNSLRDACREEVFEFLRENRPTLEELAQELARCGTLDSEQLAIYLARVDNRRFGIDEARPLQVVVCDSSHPAGLL